MNIYEHLQKSMEATNNWTSRDFLHKVYLPEIIMACAVIARAQIKNRPGSCSQIVLVTHTRNPLTGCIMSHAESTMNIVLQACSQGWICLSA